MKNNSEMRFPISTERLDFWKKIWRENFSEELKWTYFCKKIFDLGGERMLLLLQKDTGLLLKLFKKTN